MKPIPEQPEDVRARPALITIAATVATIFACVLVVAILMAFRTEGGGRSDEARPSLVPPAAPFEERTVIEDARARQVRALDTWTWTDRAHRRARMPVSAAFDRYLQSRGAP